MAATTSAQIEKILARTIDDAGCLVWQGCCANGHPAARIDGRPQLVRRVIWERLHGEIAPGGIIKMACETPLCINPECMTLTTHKALAKVNGALGLMSGPVRSAAIARAKRQHTQSKLTPEAVADIRASGDLGRVLAARWGVSQPHISKVQLHKAQRNFSSPFSGLGARI